MYHYAASIVKAFILIIAILFSSCASQPDDAIEYVIRSETTGFSVVIKIPDLGETRYHVPAYLPQGSVIKTNHTNLSHGYFQLQGAHLFRCIGDTNQLRRMRLVWEVPNDWRIANSFGYGSKTQDINTSCRQLADSIFAGGPHLSLTPTPFGVLAITGLSVDPGRLSKLIEANMRLVEEFWQDKPGSYFLVLVNQQITEEPYQNGGSAHLNSFQLQLKGNETDEALKHLIAHEYIHHWVGGTIKPLPVENELEHLDICWFIEGFTDYLAFKLTGIQPVEKSWENLSLLELKRNYKNNHTYFDIPYAQGRKIAAAFENKIKAYSGKTFRDFMIDLLRRAKNNPDFYITRESFLRVMCEGGYFDCTRAKRMLDRYVIQGEQFKSQA